MAGDQATIFALTPAQADNLVIDYTSSEGKKLYTLATTKLNIAFDGSPSTLKIFMESLRQHAHSSNWAQIMTIPDSQGIPRSIVDEYGLITMEDVRAHVDTYFWLQGRDAQNSYQLYTCLAHSITPEAAEKVNSDLSKYLLGPKKDPSGVCYLYALIKIATLHTRATVNTIRTSLFTLEKHMIRVNYNIETFNLYVKTQRQSLMSSGEPVAGLITNLFLAYDCVPDPVFKAYMTTQQDAYVDSREDFSEDRLMEVALNKFRILVESDRWNTPSEQESKIIALTAEIHALKQIKPIASNNEERKARSNRKDKAGYEWKKVPPEEHEPNHKTVGKNTYNWCKHHMYWTIHTSDECRGVKGGQHQTKNSNNKVSKDKILQATNALVSLMDEDDEME